MLAHTHEIRVTWGDCDPAGIVFYPRYYAWFDASTHALLAAAGLGHAALRERYGVVGAPLVHAEADFRGPATYDDALTAHSRVTDLGRSRFSVAHTLSVGDRLVCEGLEVRVWAAAHPDDPTRLATRPIPEEVRRALRGEGASP